MLVFVISEAKIAENAFKCWLFTLTSNAEYNLYFP